MHSSILKRVIIIALLILAFSVSIPFRLNFINNNTNELDECHLNMLIIMKVWEADGAFYHKLSPCITFPNSGDKFAAYFKRLEDRKGDNYYISYPPLIYIVTYPLTKIVGISNAKLMMQIVNLLAHLISCLLIYFIVLEYFKKKQDSFFIPAFIAFSIYAFSPLMLTFHTHIYFPEMAGQFMFILVLYYTLKLINRDREVSVRSLSIFGFLIFLFIYSDWLGVFFVLALVLLLYLKKKQANIRKLLVTVLVSAFLGLVVILIQYSLINGIRSLMVSLFMRFAERSGFFPQGYFSLGDNFYNWNTYKLFINNFFNNIGLFGLAGIIMFIIWLLSQKVIKCYGNLIKNKLVFLTLIPSLMSAIIFFNATAIHYHYYARIIVPLSLGTGILSYLFIQKITAKFKKPVTFITLIILFGIVSFSLIQYYNNEKKVLAMIHPGITENASKYISENSTNDEVIFLNYKPLGYQPVIYLTSITERNILDATSLEDAYKRFEVYPQKKAVLITVDELGNLCNEHFSKK